MVEIYAGVWDLLWLLGINGINMVRNSENVCEFIRAPAYPIRAQIDSIRLGTLGKDQGDLLGTQSDLVGRIVFFSGTRYGEGLNRIIKASKHGREHVHSNISFKSYKLQT